MSKPTIENRPSPCVDRRAVLTTRSDIEFRAASVTSKAHDKLQYGLVWDGLELDAAYRPVTARSIAPGIAEPASQRPGAADRRAAPRPG